MPPMKCKHQNLQILEQVAGKRSYSQQPEFREFIDWHSTIVQAHYLKVTKYWCPSCGEIIPAPSYAKDE